MATSQIKNARQIFIGNGAAALSGTSVVSPADGEIIILNESGQRVTDSNVAATTKFRLVLGRTGESDLVSDLIEKSTISDTKLGVGAARANQVTTVGYDGTSGSLPVTNSNLYYIRLYIQELLSSNSDGQRIKHGVFKSDAAATQAEIAIGLVDSLVNNFKREAEQYIKFKAIINTAASATNDLTNDATFTRGSKTFSLATATTYNGTSANLAVGDFIRIAADAAVTNLATDNATTRAYPVYRVEKIGASAPFAITVDRPIDHLTVAGNTVLADSDDATQVIPAATAASASFGIVMDGQDLSFGSPDYKYSIARWETQLENFGTTSAVVATGASPGVGTYESIASLEAFLMGGYGEIYRMGAPLTHPQVLVAESAVAGGHYTLCTFNFKDSKVTGSFSEEVSPKSMIVACPTDCGAFAVTATAHSLGKLLTALTGVTITWTT